MRNARRLVLIALAVGVVMLAGCGDGGQVADPLAGYSPAVEDPAAGAATVPGNVLAVGSLVAAELPTLGPVVTDDQGWVLYRFDKDSATPSAVTCIGDCATRWPPVLTDGAPELDGVAADLVGSVVRPDGIRQVTLAGWPLYRYAGDTAPGEWHGQGKNSAWYAVLSTGKKNTRPAVEQAGSATRGATGEPGPGTTEDYGTEGNSTGSGGY
jgi:predicted lipoprotein with Yx(FWY)xxD motif